MPDDCKRFVRRESLTAGAGLTMPRIFDLLILTLLLPVVVPVFLLVSLLVSINFGKPFLFTQQRPGLNGIIFRIYKFRTMTNARDLSGNLLPDAQRLTAFGKLLRASSLDELPSLFNLAKGEIRLVGPRPLLVEYLVLYTPEQKRRHDVAPGITGWAQIMGRNSLTWDEKFALDLWYIEHRSFWLDVKILFMTVWRVMSRHGISADGEATMPRFTGIKQ